MSKHRNTPRPRRHRAKDATTGKRFIDYPRRGKGGVRRWLPSWRQVLCAFALCVGVLTGLFAWAYSAFDIPDENAAARQEANTYYWSDGTQMVSLGALNRNIVRLSDVPESVQNAVIAAENESFYRDSGVSFQGIVRAGASAVKGEETQGGSTITQQYVKNTYLSQEQTVSRKVKEFVISLKVDRTKSKQEILQGYLNTSWFGRGAYGIEAAAQAYYGIPAKNLDPSQGAMLAALLKGAELYDPSTGSGNHARAVDRWKWILDRQVKAGLMSRADRDKYRTFPEPRKQSTSTNLGGQTGYLVDVANKYIKQRTLLTDQELARGGYKIHTTFDKNRMRQLSTAVEGVLRENIDPGKRDADKGVQVGAASVRPSDGAILALYGGPDATKHFTNNADTFGVPVGSAFKPFVLASALEHGALPRGGDGGRQDVSPDTYYGDDGGLRVASDGAGPDESHPTLRQALTTGGNATYVQLGRDVGLEKVRETAMNTGLLKESLAELEQTFPIGTSTPSAIRMAGAYGTFANHGLQNDPYSVTKLLKDGTSIGGFESRAKPRQALEKDVADKVSDALRDAGSKSVADMDADTAERIGPFAAGRTGDQDRLRSAWFVGSTDKLSTAVTMFRTLPDEPRLLPMSDVGGDSTQRGNAFPARIWADYTGAR
ncbi:transglycosylase domain-containing protein [Streptomyces griseocarneus]|uniref:transglycosylase domain-containing protein n=1 Tax=Streptomyces griseocarneus TaxID=51201 RepID=UPI00167EA3C7|nr:transglycosylase domain-containing protein [Streptomyces griseocarneus]MBZ6477132.1 penicillin-binding protein [Streptomyces griseocarneus]GHG53733.1 penicillin-binding protein [Streptomyces griseocarneus]